MTQKTELPISTNQKGESMKTKPASVLITGGSSGIGRALVQAYAKGSYLVFALSRNPLKAQASNVIPIACDITRPDHLARALDQISHRIDRLDLLICCAGYGIAGVTEESDLKKAKDQFDVNFFGSFSTIQFFLPLLKAGSGSKIIFISSVASQIAIPYQAFYSASKAAMDNLLEAWQLELRPFGIQICSFLLGDTKTGFSRHRQKADTQSPKYRFSLNRSIRKMEKDEAKGLDPAYTAGEIYAYSQRKHLSPRQTIGWQYRLFLFLAKILPKKLILFLVAQLYT